MRPDRDPRRRLRTVDHPHKTLAARRCPTPAETATTSWTPSTRFDGAVDRFVRWPVGLDSRLRAWIEASDLRRQLPLARAIAQVRPSCRYRPTPAPPPSASATHPPPPFTCTALPGDAPRSSTPSIVTCASAVSPGIDQPQTAHLGRVAAGVEDRNPVLALRHWRQVVHRRQKAVRRADVRQDLNVQVAGQRQTASLLLQRPCCPSGPCLCYRPPDRSS